MLNFKNYQVAIVGGGMVGLATACGLAEAGIHVVVIDSSAAAQAATGNPKLRVSAINKASQTFLENLGVWQQLSPSRLSCYQKMDVWQKNSMGRIQFDARDINEASLGTIVENAAIEYALSQRAAQLEKLTLFTQTKIKNIAFGNQEAWLTLENNDNISASLVIGADGANSWVRQQCQIPITFWDYNHHAIVATIRTQLPHGHCARQVFTKTGPLAFLPLYDEHLCSIVYSVPPAQAEKLLQVSPTEFERKITAEIDGNLGICALESERQTFPLRMRYARHFARHRLLLAGDAAHTIHPLAGQGVNLGFLDAAAIIQVVTGLHKKEQDLGDYSSLRELERWRKAEALEMIASMEGLKRLFDGEHPLKKAVSSLGLSLVDNVSGVKTVFMQQAMGYKFKLPDLCRKNNIYKSI